MSKSEKTLQKALIVSLLLFISALEMRGCARMVFIGYIVCGGNVQSLIFQYGLLLLAVSLSACSELVSIHVTFLSF